ncbi:MAG: glycosyltransferase family 4 protein [Frankiaceae bacterium]|nr:glycosyltransferase family 4 protein [Arenimonas sp.]
MTVPSLPRVAVVLSHPTQYYAPWFRRIAQRGELELIVFYLWDFGVQARYDRDFGQLVKWDIPLLDGYRNEFVPNASADPGTHHARGLDNPALAGKLVAARPDAIVMFGYTYLSHLRVLMSPRLGGIPLLLRGDSHDKARGTDWREIAKRVLRKIAFRRFSRFLAVGSANADYLRASGVPASRIDHVPHCVDNKRFQQAAASASAQAAAWRSELGIAANAMVVLFAGKFEEKKRPLDLLAAFIRLQDRDPAAARMALLFVGSGSQAAQLQAQAGDRIGRSVFFAPFQNQSGMPKVYACADVLVLPSFGNGETWGLAVNEAMNLARPCIVSTHVGCGPDLIRDGENGWMFEAGDVDALSGVLAKALDVDRNGLAAMGERARRRIDEFSFDAAAAALRDAVHTAISPSRRYAQ